MRFFHGSTLTKVILMLYLGYVFVHLLWRIGFNPDNNSIPILTALADLLGSLLFAVGFLFLESIHDPNAVAYVASDLSSFAVVSAFTGNGTDSLRSASTFSV